jgi:hypothetical protein
MRRRAGSFDEQIAPAARRGWRSERGQIGGFEVLPFGLLLFVSAMLVVTNAWAVIDSKMATSAASREATRAYVESTNAADANDALHHRAHEALAAYGRDGDRVEIEVDAEPFGRCARVTVAVSYRVPALTVPFIGGFGSGVIARSRHSEVVDPYRSGLPEGACAE